MTRYCYFADYEIMSGDRFRTWGQTTLDYRVDDAEAFDPAAVVAQVRQQVADAQGVRRSDVRIRVLNRI